MVYPLPSFLENCLVFMIKIPLQLLALLVLAYAPSFAQKKLKKSDRVIVANLQTHVTFLKGDKLEGRKAGSEGEKLADEYIIRHFSKSGLKPRGENQWYQEFNIYDGKEIKPSTTLVINEDQLKLHEDYFPFSFSGNKSTEAAVAIALAENGVPWFKDIKELINDEDTLKADTFGLIRKSAIQAAAKGASALVIYNRSGKSDLEYNRYDTSQAVDIPVIYITNNAFKKYSADESAIIDVKLNVELEPKSRTGNNVIGFADHGADSTVITSAHLGKETEIAALIEAARLIKASKTKARNYLFVAFCGEGNGLHGENYFNHHPPVDFQSVNKKLNLDELAATVKNPKGLNLVKRSVEIIKNN